jgi:hypothetical protein
MSTEDPQFLSDMLWSLVIAALIAPELILTTQTLWRVRSAKGRHARRDQGASAAAAFPSTAQALPSVPGSAP